MTASLHDRLLVRLQEVAQVSIVSKLRDPRLRLPDDSRLTVFLPDLHLVSAHRQFLFRTNAVATLAAVLRAVRTFKAEAQPSRVVLYQIGDLLDLWREADGFDPNADIASAIEDSHSGLMEALYDPDLDAQFLLGNHDYDLYRFPNYDTWQRYAYPSPSLLVMHGDVLDWVEALPDQLQQFFVYLFAPGVKPGQAQLRAMRELNRQLGEIRQLNEDFAGTIAPIRRLMSPNLVRDADRFNVQDAQSPPGMLALFDPARRKCSEADERFGLSITTAVIGHTHHARLVVQEDGDRLFALVDCGAWIESCVTEDDPVPRPNAQVGVVGADEIRIYQLGPL